MYKVVPMTRLGQESYQPSRSSIYKQLNRILSEGKEVHQVRRKTRFATERFPEGHLFFPGTILVQDEDEISGAKVDRLESVSLNGLSQMKLMRKIAFLDGQNCASFCSDPFRHFFSAYGLAVDWLSDMDIRQGKLKDYDLLIVPGGPDAGESYYEGLGEKGYEEIRNFVQRGGMYLGSCAGSYFPLSAKQGTVQADVWLHMIEATDESGLDYWRTGTGFVRIEFEDVDHPIAMSLALGEPSTMDVIYWEGPAFSMLENSNVQVIARYKDFLASGASMPSWSLENNQIARDAMEWSNPLTRERFDHHLKGYPAIVEASYGKGHMVLLSPHAEFGTCGTEHTMADNPNYVLLMNSIYYLSSKGGV
ncbi:BPL-N domain-containing protein [Sporosarcina sp. 179-K 3D1 HS]|uniref:BPL-N domain-containing protein n=1 Tax=Sporosarcina sp. 179-K 3D1 HS TaxID=3232169 RepID=UPI0039A164A2